MQEYSPAACGRAETDATSGLGANNDLDAHINALRELVDLKLALMPPAAPSDRPEIVQRLRAIIGRFGM